MLSLVLPTFNERQNLPELLKVVCGVLSGKEYEVIIVDDDSPDKTWQAAEELRAQYPAVRVLRRVGKKGLSSAVVDGFAIAKGDVLMVMDSDLQHDPQLIVSLWEAIEKGAVIAVASRYMAGGSVGNWVQGRRLISKTATYLAQSLPNVRSSDPMSGFFAVRHDAFTAMQHKLRPTGFKILLEVLAFLPKGSRITEVPLVFRERLHGESKLSMKVEMEFLLQLVRIAWLRFLNKLRRWQWAIFIVICLLFAIPYALRLVQILPIYTDPKVRSEVQTAMPQIAEKQGWLLSDLVIQRVTAQELELAYVPHKRGYEPSSCWIYTFANSSLKSCQ